VLSDVLSNCTLCPRKCGVDRLCGQTGICGAGNRAEIYTYGPHHGEEPPISGTRGSGTVFFSRCTLKCIYCQNYLWSQDGCGKSYETDGIVSILRSLYDHECHNWNFVSPTPWLPMILEAVARLKECGVSLPIVYNTSSFETVSTLSSLAGTVDVYLADLRYASDETSLEGSGAKDYVQVARAAISEMWAQVGDLAIDADGVASRGLICRVLVLPGRAEEAVESLRWLADTFGTAIAVSVMSQYTPLHLAEGRKLWGRRVTRDEYDVVCDAVDKFGLVNGWIQDFDESAPADLVGENMEPVVKISS
jgi:putative pyruvate formate lyase activating enzyme